MIKARHLLAAIGATCLSITATQAVAQPTPEQYEKIRNTLDEADANGDGKVTRREFDGHRAATFERLDRNADGVVDYRDAPRIRFARRKFDTAFEQVAELYDTNFDRRVTRYEWDHPKRDIFALIDKDEDGVVVLSELPKSL